MPDAQADQPMMDFQMHESTFANCPKVFCNYAHSGITSEDVTLSFCLKQSIKPDDSEEPMTVLYPQVMVFMSVPHFMRLADVIHGQAERIRAQIVEQQKELLNVNPDTGPDQVI